MIHNSRVTLGKEITLYPIIIRARAILAIPDKSKRKSEWQVVDQRNKSLLSDPSIHPRIFLECDVVKNGWGNVSVCIYDIENHKMYQNVTGTSYCKDPDTPGKLKSRSYQYLKSLPGEGKLQVSQITNFQEVINAILEEN